MLHRTQIDVHRVRECIERLREIPRHVEGIELIVLFGSLAAGRTHVWSDVDLAFQVSDLDETKRIRIWEQTADTLEIDEVDIVYLNDDLPYRLKFEIGWKGRLLYEAREGLFSDFKVRAAAMWFDFKPYADYQSRKFWEHVRAKGFGS